MTTHRGLAVRTGIVFLGASFALLAAACAAPVDDVSNSNGSKAGAVPVKGGSGSDLATGLTGSSGGSTGSGGATGSGGDSGAGGSAASGGDAGAAGTGGSVGDPGLSGYWSFEDKSGSILDSSGNANDGTLSGTGVSVSPNGEQGSALSFSGGDGRLAIPSDTSLDFSSAATIEFWVRLTSLTNGSLVTRVSSTGDGVRVRTSQGNLQVTFNYASGASSVTSNPGVIGPAWSHVAVVNDGTNLDLYVDGKLIESSQGGKLGAVTGDLVVGHSSPSDTAIQGYFDELRWYTVARSPEEICSDAAGTWSGSDCQ